MRCCKCDKDLVECICDDVEERLASLKGCKFLDPYMLERIDAERFLNKYKIEEERKK